MSSPAAPSDLEPTPAPPGAVRVLVVEDDEVIGGLLVTILETEGYDVRLAADGELAKAELDRGATDVVVLDLMLPKRDGKWVLRTLREHGPGHPAVLVLTARGGRGDAVDCFDDGADDFVTKPFDPDELLARIRRLARSAP